MNKIEKKQKDKGFSLIELILYIGLASLILGAITYFIIMVLEARVKNQTIAEVSGQGVSAMQVISQAVRNAEDVNSPVKGNESDSLSLDVYESTDDPTVFDLSNGKLWIKEGLEDPVELTNSRVIVSDFTIKNVSKNNRQKTIRIQFTITHLNPENKNEFNYSETFYETANIK